jgi:osmotically-inducible protein OsmY
MKTNLTSFLLFILSLTLSSALAAGAPGTPPDTELIDRVRTALGAAVGPAARDIEVIVTGGVVLLHGRTSSAALRESAVQAVERTPGVTAVDSRLRVERRS